MTNRFEGQFDNEDQEIEELMKAPGSLSQSEQQKIKDLGEDVFRDLAILLDRSGDMEKKIFTFDDASIVVLRLLKKMNLTADDSDGTVYSVALLMSQDYSPSRIAEMLQISDEGVEEAQEKIKALQDRTIPLTKEQILDKDFTKED